jgi:aspartate racemase
MEQKKTVGIIGGMGPSATVEFFRRLVVATPARSDQDHLHILIDNNPAVPSRTDAILYHGPSPLGALIEMAKGLENMGAQVLAMPCNTAHSFRESMQAAVSVPLLDMISETVARTNVASVGLLATTGTVRTHLYHRAFAHRGIELLVPHGPSQQTVARAIEAIKAGRRLNEVAVAIAGVVAELRMAGAEAVVAGCTEISLIDGAAMSLPWIDALDCLVDATIREAIPSQDHREGRTDDRLESSGLRGD